MTKTWTEINEILTQVLTQSLLKFLTSILPIFLGSDLSVLSAKVESWANKVSIKIFLLARLLARLSKGVKHPDCNSYFINKNEVRCNTGEFQHNRYNR